MKDTKGHEGEEEKTFWPQIAQMAADEELQEHLGCTRVAFQEWVSQIRAGLEDRNDGFHRWHRLGKKSVHEGHQAPQRRRREEFLAADYADGRRLRIARRHQESWM